MPPFLCMMIADMGRITWTVEQPRGDARLPRRLLCRVAQRAEAETNSRS